MPYIEQTRRDWLQTTVVPDTVGELNYCFTDLIISYWEDNKSYQTINDIIGALESCKLEFYRRIAVPYEDKKIVENGDVY